ncbi:hypothetical protein [Mammaliicoccus vitulinus]|uniref:hypothetical protein n=1 Tax=Mammaliicoccus vitulinus TaxID=71237 RepID=UPI00145BD1D8|nr:hypothetical protein [Mammaliicoccus vitulinus]QJF24955.1 hypothetical protein HF021_05510 [Mammaliicoccus vitulinus]
MENSENKAFVVDDYKIIKINANLYEVEMIFNAKSKNKNEVYDLSVEVRSENINHEHRVGNKRKKEMTLEKWKGKKFKPYFTDKYENLSFKK